MGIRIAFTGWADLGNGTMVLRDRLKRTARAAGYEVQDGLYQSTEVLIVNPKLLQLPEDKWTSKMRKAKAKGVRFMSYQHFVECLNMLGLDPTTKDAKVAPEGITVECDEEAA